MFMDCTHKTDRYRMPLLNIAGQSPTNKTFCIGFAFIHNEREESFIFVLTVLRKLYEDLNIPLPSAAVIDKNRALINSLKEVLPNTHILLCIWHSNMNILKHAKVAIHQSMQFDNFASDKDLRKCVDVKWNQMLHLWIQVVQARTEAQIVEHWSCFEAQYSGNIFAGVL